MGERMCVCGHLESEHEEVSNPEFTGQKVCIHDPDPENPDSVLCDCMNFELEETERPAAGSNR